MSVVSQHETLLNKLSYHQEMINGILDMPCNNMHVKLAAIERKIVAMEELVLELPYDDESTSFHEWRLTISDLYRRFFQMVSEKKKKKPEKVVVPLGKTTKESSTQKDAASNDEIETGNGSPTANTGAVTSSGNNMANKKRTQSITSEEHGNGDRAKQSFRRPGPIKQTYRNMSFRRTSGALPSAEPVVEKSIEEQKEELKTLYEGFFSKLEPVAELTADSDLEGLRILSLIVNRCIRQMIPFEDDTQLLSDLLNYALPKAPKSVIERYNSLNEEAERNEVEKDTENKDTENKDTENKDTENKDTENKDTENKDTENKDTENKGTENKDTENNDESMRPPLKGLQGLRLLKKCLINELTSYYEASKAALVTEEGDCGEPTEGQHCFYCKSNGHYKVRCPLVRNQICFRCFKRGHKAKECGGRCFKCGLTGHYKKFCKI